MACNPPGTAIATTIFFRVTSTAAFGQELEPRAYGIAPSGTTIVLAGVAFDCAGRVSVPRGNSLTRSADHKIRFLR